MVHGTTQSNSENINWETPKQGNFGYEDWGLAEIVRDYKLELDVCADSELNSCCKKFYTKEQTYKKEWDVNFWMNPPWKTEIMIKMLCRAISQSQHHGVLGVCLLPSYTGATWFHELVYEAGGRIIPIHGRVKYWRYGEPWKGSPNIDSIMVVYSYGKL